jgi:flagellar operon protein
MVNKINANHPVWPLQPGKSDSKDISKTQKEAKTIFNEILQKQLVRKKLKLSGHCIKRLQQNDIKLTESQIDKLVNAVDKADRKGAKESLIVMDNLAFVVSIKNGTVITAVDSQRMKENIFTNIDSAVIL